MLDYTFIFESEVLILDVGEVHESERFEINVAKILGTADFSSHFAFVLF